MFKKYPILAVVALAVVIAAPTAIADWDPEDGWKMHFPQLPNVVGWDVNATEPIVLADDWTCSETGWVEDIHFWGSWMHGLEGDVIAFQISIYADIPANPPEVPYSRPGELLWERQVSDFMIALPDDPPGPEGWYDPSTGAWFPEDHFDYFQYNVFLTEPDWFWQIEGTIYWLAISAVVADPVVTQWGWKSTLDHWSDDAVWAFLGEYNWIDMWEPPNYEQSLDLAFVITSGLECEPTLDSSTCNTVTCPVGSDQCLPMCARYDPAAGDNTIVECQCIPPDSCHAVMPTGVWSSCIVPDNGTGTADLPPSGCQYQSPDEKWMITGGLPPGTTIEMVGIIEDFYNVVTGSGGSLGGEYEQFDATLDLTVSGTGSLAGFNRHLAVPIFCETHSAPRTPGDPVQTFVVDFDSLEGELFGDPDFCTFRIEGGSAFGMPSPGRTRLIELPSGDFAVESFFDVVYQIEFEGCPGSQLDGYMGTTTDTIHIRTGSLPPQCDGDCPPGWACEEVETFNEDGTVDICCECVQQVCEPNYDSSACKVGTCETPGDECQPICMVIDIESGQINVDSCECIVESDCHAVPSQGVSSSCVVPDNGTGTADLPPDGCQYQSPDEKWMIKDGLPPGTTIEMAGIIEDFINVVTGSGGSLGGEYEQFEATLDLTVSGTGSLAGFNRHLAVPIFCETHSAPRTPGDPVQTFVVDFDSLDGELFGDPDFCEFIIKGGTGFGMSSPGQTRLIELPSGDFAIESFFDVVYQIEFEGCPGSQLDSYMGTTTDTIRIRTGLLSPECEGDCPPGWACEEVETVNADGTIEVCCECQPEVCEPTDDGLGCKTHTCPLPEEECLPICTEYDPESGQSIVIDCICQDSTDCHAVIPQGSLSACVVPDNGSGTADLPPAGCQYQSPDDVWMITAGLPPGTTIEMDGILKGFVNVVTGSGGSLDGEYQQFDATLDLTVTGTGSLAGFNRHLSVPVFCETHSAPRAPGLSVQMFAVDFNNLDGELFGDPDFCEFIVTGGSANDMPSPGYTTLRELPNGSFAVESFFDIVHQIEFEGCPGSQLDGYTGTTTDTIRVRTGASPSCEGDCLPGEVCEEVVTVNEDGTLEICCECLPEVCEPTPDSAACRTVGCPGPDDDCVPVCLEFDPATGSSKVVDCECIVESDCHAVPSQGVSSSCVVPDNGTGTADLPPDGCEYQSPDDMWMITAGLPPGTTIEMDGILKDFVNVVTGSGGSLGGEYEQFDATLDLTVSGTGSLAGFNRHLSVPVFCETHSAPRTPGDPVQTFVVDFDSLDGELFGDPDFCEFIVTGGTAYGMQSPGQTRLIELPSGDFAIESFFDVVYQIEFEGCPGSQLDSYMGTTTDTIHIRTGLLPPECEGDCPPGWACEEVETVNADGTIEVCCECQPEVCEPTDDGLGCKTHTCPLPEDECLPICVQVNPESGATTVLDCVCTDSTDCHVEFQIGTWSSCVVPGNGSGTTNLPPIGCQYQSPDEKWEITGGLPPETTIEIDGILTDFQNVVVRAGGSLGGHYEQFDATLEMTIVGTGELQGFERTIWMAMDCETHSGPRQCNPVQRFETDLYYMFGEQFGDPDFCEFIIRAGTSFGMPSPGHTTLRELPDGTFAVESFFDITYEIQFEGCPGSPLDSYSGTSNGTIRVRTGILPPECAGNCPPDQVCEPVVTVDLDGTIDYCCECVPDQCEPMANDSSNCRPHDCLVTGEECMSICVQVDLESGMTRVVTCECVDSTHCHLASGPAENAIWPCDPSSCVVPDNGTGTADLPPAGCQYQSPDDMWMITAGLPPGTTIEMDGILMNFVNVVTGSGGSLGGEYEQFDATLDLTVTGTGSLAGFNRHLSVPVFCETHSAPRTPGDPVQTFAVVFDSLNGKLFGDPDFCTFRIEGGSAFGMESPGQTRLVELPSGDFAVESFFDVVYQIEFEGCPGSQLSDYMGTTTDTIHIRTGLLPPQCEGDCPPGDSCIAAVIYNSDGTADYCCGCVDAGCETIIGDANNTGGEVPIDIDDVVYLIAYIFSGGGEPMPYRVASGDADCSCDVDIDDVVYLITYIFSGGPPPCTCEEWVGLCGALH